ncbi:hypothetical protein F9B74_04475 [Pelistega sp. NLN82]|uniref:Lipoprotein n=1 Tax=Pelistega ratti TaxID=2652177 RepID=A0A6L9Y6Z9_9BURK|nr:hypothetical protein [Pelistega ratti]NEN75584.1 hypothetical protein [Pelistega ratti]
MIHRHKLIVTLILMSIGISACGYKAPVYYPTEAQRQELAEKEARIKARKQAKKAQQEANQTQPSSVAQ